MALTYPTTPTPVGGEPQTPCTALPERLLRALQAHQAAETASIEEYERLSASSGDPLVALLMGLIVQDEHRHHALLDQMVGHLMADLETPPDAPVVSETDLEALVVTTRALIREEREGARYLRHLARQEPRLCEGAYALLLETMARDSEKHEHMLRFILRRLEGTS